MELIKKWKNLSTAVVGNGGDWRLGAKLEIIQVATECLKTKRDKSTKDNLENPLPKFDPLAVISMRNANGL